MQSMVEGGGHEREDGGDHATRIAQHFGGRHPEYPIPVFFHEPVAQDIASRTIAKAMTFSIYLHD
jgi:hypothetical protein